MSSGGVRAAAPEVAEAMGRVEARMRLLLTAPDDRRAEVYGWLRYQLGWSDLHGQPEEARSAKGVRPRATLLAALGAGHAGDAAEACAAAVELTHEFSLIHDDLQDGDRTRRGRPALWTAIGAAQAIAAGDLLWAIARHALSQAEVEPTVAMALLRRYDAACIQLAEGQHLDLGFEHAERVLVADYRQMIEAKTGALLGLAMALGVRAGGGDAALAERLDRFGRRIGVAFQVRDDWLGYWGDPSVTGKPAAADLQRRKKSLPLLLALEQEGEDGPLSQLLRSKAISQEAAVSMAARMKERGIADQVAAEATRLAEAAMDELRDAPLEAIAARQLEALARRAAHRER